MQVYTYVFSFFDKSHKWFQIQNQIKSNPRSDVVEPRFFINFLKILLIFFLAHTIIYFLNPDPNSITEKKKKKKKYVCTYVLFRVIFIIFRFV